MASPTTSTAAFAASNGPTSSNVAPHRKNAAQRNRSESPYQQRTTQSDLGTMARFHNYSFGNILQIARQRPTATRVAGFSAWKELGRFVKRGEKGIQILAPVTGYRRRKDETEGETDSKPQPVLMGFRAVYVFDYAQTEGVDLPELEHTIGGEVGSNRDRLVSFLARQKIALELNENIAPALGVSYGGRIALLPGQSKAEEFTTLVHETAHLCCVRSYVA
jgi:hypothetical protein